MKLYRIVVTDGYNRTTWGPFRTWFKAARRALSIALRNPTVSVDIERANLERSPMLIRIEGEHESREVIFETIALVVLLFLLLWRW